MSRHRFVKNLDLDGKHFRLLSNFADVTAEMEEEEEEEDEDGMTAEQKGR